MDSAARRLQQIDELTKRKAAGEQLDVTQELFLLRNRNAPSELVGSVGRLVDAQKRIGQLPRSAKLGRLLEAPTFKDALQIARKNPGEIAAALGLESAPDALMGLAALAALGPLAGGAVLTGTAGAQGYASGLIGALSMEGVDLADREQLKRALRDNDLMQRVRARAGTQAAIEAGITAAMALPVFLRGSRKPTGLKRTREQKRQAKQLEINLKNSKQHESEVVAKHRRRGKLVATQLTIETKSGHGARLDLAVLDPKTGEITCIECKFGETARLSKKQRKAYPEVQESGAVIKGRRDESIFPGGTKIPAKAVEIDSKF